jgi:hypothetical protein
MPRNSTARKARADLRQGKRPTTAAGEFVREEIEHVRQGKHGARSTKQAIAIGLSKARRAGIPLEPPKKGTTSARTRRSAEQAYEVGQGEREPRASSSRRSRATRTALEREPHRTASKSALSRQARTAAHRRTRTSSASRGQRRAGSSSHTSRSHRRTSASSHASA